MSVDRAKTTISLVAEEALCRMLDAANREFDAGRITKQELVSWIVIRFEEKYFAGSLSRLRVDHFDEIAYLESVIAKARAGKNKQGETPQLSELLSPLTKKLQPKKRGKRLRQTSKCPETSGPFDVP